MTDQALVPVRIITDRFPQPDRAKGATVWLTPEKGAAWEAQGLGVVLQPPEPPKAAKAAPVAPVVVPEAEPASMPPPPPVEAMAAPVAAPVEGGLVQRRRRAETPTA